MQRRGSSLSFFLAQFLRALIGDSGFAVGRIIADAPVGEPRNRGEKSATLAGRQLARNHGNKKFLSPGNFIREKGILIKKDFTTPSILYLVNKIA